MNSFLDRYFIKKPRLRRWVTRALEGNREQDVELLGGLVRVHSVKENGYLRASRLVRRSSLLRDELAVIVNLASLLGPGDTFVDIGANVGIFSITLARLGRIHPTLSFHAFEANPDTYTRLQTQAAPLGIKTWNLALSDRDGELTFVSGAVSHVFTTLEHASAYSIDSETVCVPSRRLDSLAISGDSIVLKIDVEGQELQVLQGARSFFDAGRIRAVYLDGYSDPSTEQFLRDRGFRLLEGRTLQPTDGNVFSLLALRDRTAVV